MRADAMVSCSALLNSKWPGKIECCTRGQVRCTCRHLQIADMIIGGWTTKHDTCGEHRTPTFDKLLPLRACLMVILLWMHTWTGLDMQGVASSP